MSQSRLGMGAILLFLVSVWNLPITGGEASNRSMPGDRRSIYPRTDESAPAAPKLVRVSYCLRGTSGRDVLCLLPSSSANLLRL